MFTDITIGVILLIIVFKTAILLSIFLCNIRHKQIELMSRDVCDVMSIRSFRV